MKKMRLNKQKKKARSANFKLMLKKNMYVQYTFIFFFNFDSIASKNFHIIFIPLDAGFRSSQDTHLKLYLEKIENNNISYFL